MRYILFSLQILFAASSVNAEAIQLGVLDESHIDGFDSHNQYVIPLFEYENGIWQKYSGKFFEHEDRWKVVFDGRDVGTIKLKDISSCIHKKTVKNCDFEHRYELVGSESTFKKKNKGNAFGWGSLYRPLVVGTNISHKDRLQWKPFIPASKEFLLAFDALKKSIPLTHQFICTDNELGTATEWKPEYFEAKKSYSSIKEHKLVQIGFKYEYYQCDGPPDEGYLSTWYYFLDAENFLLLERDMSLVEAADFDSDGSVDLLFKTYGYFSYGYVLFYDNLSKSSYRVWSTGG